MQHPLILIENKAVAISVIFREIPRAVVIVITVSVNLKQAADIAVGFSIVTRHSRVKQVGEGLMEIDAGEILRCKTHTPAPDSTG